MSKPYKIERYDGRVPWLYGRKHGLGASEDAAVLGLDGGTAAYTIATEKLAKGIDNTPPDETSEWGIRHEPAIAKKFHEVTGIELYDPGDWAVFRSVERPHLFCTPDRLVVKGDEVTAAAEIKTSYYEVAKEWAHNVPRKYRVQLQMTMYVLGVDHGYFAALLNGCHFVYHPMKRSEKFLAWALPRLDAFWESLSKGEMPNVDASNATARALALRYQHAEPSPVELPVEMQEAGDRYDKLCRLATKIDKAKLGIQNRVKATLGNRSIGVLPDQTGFAWSANGKGGRKFARKKKVRLPNE